MIKLKIKKLHSDAIVPVYATDGAACFDLHCIGLVEQHPTDPKARIFHTGLSVEIPRGWAMFIYSRSGHGFKQGMRLSNCVGVIDSDYRGEVMVSLRVDGEQTDFIHSGYRIAQAMLAPIERVEFDVADELTNTARGTGGLGSTGK